MYNVLRLILPLVEEYGMTIMIVALFIYIQYKDKEFFKHGVEQDHNNLEDTINGRFDQLNLSLTEIHGQLTLVTSALINASVTSSEGVLTEHITEIIKAQRDRVKESSDSRRGLDNCNKRTEREAGQAKGDNR